MGSEAKRCAEMVADPNGWHSFQCRNNAKYGKFCGVHCPKKKAERAAKRPPRIIDTTLIVNREKYEAMRDRDENHARAMAEKDEEIGRLKAELELRKEYAEKVREQSMEIRSLKAELDTVSGMYDGMRRRLRNRKDQLKEAGRWSSHD